MRRFVSRYPVLSVIVLSALCLLPAMALRDYSPSNELRYLSIADEALREGHFFAFTNHGADYADKPPLFLWLLMLSRLIFGGFNTLALELPLSFLPFCGCLVVCDRFLGTVLKQRSACERIADSLLTGTSLLTLAQAAVLRMDMLMTFFILLALFSFWRLYTGEGNTRRERWQLPLWVFLALFTKGPVGLLMPVLSIFAFLAASRRLKDIGRYLGWRFWLVMAVLCGLWFTGAWLEGGRQYLGNLLFHQTVDRAVSAFSHKRPFWFYLAYIWLVLVPFSLATVPAIVVSAVRRDGRTPLDLFMLCSALSLFFMLSAFSSKLFIYLLPLCPLVCCIFPLLLARTRWNWWRWGLGIFAVIFIVLGLALTALPLYWEALVRRLSIGPGYDFLASPFVCISGLVCLVGGIVCLSSLSRNWTRPVTVLGAAMLLLVASASPLLPRINEISAYGALCARIPEDAAVRTLFVSRPENMDVYLHRPITADYGKDAGALLSEMPSDGVLVLPLSRLEGETELASRLEGCRYTDSGAWRIYYLDD